MLREPLRDVHDIQYENSDMDEVLYIKLTDKHTGFTISLFGLYIPPETSSFGQNADQVYEYMGSKVYKSCDDDIILVLGDLNGRIGEKLDYIQDIDNIPPRVCIDKTVNVHGRSLEQFLIRAKMCVLNGRLCPLDDSFTSISHRGKAVVDYMITSHNYLQYFSNFMVKPVNVLVEELEITEGGYTRLSDHSLLQV